VAYGNNLQNAEAPHNVDMAFFCIAQQYFYLRCKGDEKDFSFLEVLITYFLPQLGDFNEAGVPSIICEVREGTPTPNLTYLANFSLFSQYLF